MSTKLFTLCVVLIPCQLLLTDFFVRSQIFFPLELALDLDIQILYRC